MLYISLRQYEYVVAVARTGSLTAAASLLNVSQPSLSVAITRVEDVIGQKIFERQKGASIVITPFGHRFVARARGLLEQAGSIETDADTARPFVVGCFEDIAPWSLAPALQKLRSRFPALRFEGQEGRFSDLASEISEGRIDVAITYDIGFTGSFKQRHLKRIAPVAFLATDHPLALKISLSLEQIAKHPVILSREKQSEAYVRTVFSNQHMLPEVAYRAASLETMRSMAAHGNGIGISYTRPPGELSYDGKPLVTLPISTPEAAADIILLWSGLRAQDAHFNSIIETISAGV